MPILQPLSMSGIACYTFDNWTKVRRLIKKSEKEDKLYEVQVLEQVKYLDVVIEKIKNFEHVDISNIFILGSSIVGHSCNIFSNSIWWY